jgi:two-component system, OmpR family, sensor kinase
MGDTMAMKRAAGALRRLGTVSARVRILGWVALLLALAGAAELLLQRRLLLDALDDEVGEALAQETEEVRVLAEGRDPQTGQPFGGDVVAIFDTFLRRNIPDEGEAYLTVVDGRPYKATQAPYRLDRDEALVRRWTGLREAERDEVSTPAGPVRYLAAPLSDGEHILGVFVVANFLRNELEEIDHTTRVGAIVNSSVLVIAGMLAWVIAGRVLAPVRTVTETARQLTETDLSRRIAVPTSNDEIADLARTFNSMLDRLEHAFANQRAFLNDAGHELRTPITIIRGHLELEGDDPAERRTNRALVLEELDRMGRIVEDLLVLARAEEPDFLRREAFDLDVLTTDLLSNARTLADRDWRLGGIGHSVLVADRQRLTQAVMNLLDNAARHTDPGEPIELGSSLANGQARLWVRDGGPGIPVEDQGRIFERFARAHDGHRKAGRAGLGLAIVRAVAEAHHGRVDVHSSPGTGATFTIAIPATAEGV